MESGFADQRTYIYQGRDVDQQVHLGFDLASTSRGAGPCLERRPHRASPSSSASTATASIVDHGLGLQSLYAHLSSIGVKVGDTVTQGQELGRSGTTGLAGGDHLHFTMLLGGHAVTPVDWWSQQWVQDRVLRKLREASAAGRPPAAAARPHPAAAPATAGARGSSTDRIESAHVRRGRPRDIPRDGHRRPLARRPTSSPSPSRG